MLYKDFLLEYRKTSDPSVFTTNGKSMSTGVDRKHLNTKRKEYNHKHPLVNQMTSGAATVVPLAGARLMSILQQYNITFAPGKTKTLGNSGAQVQMYTDVSGKPAGKMIRRK